MNATATPTSVTGGTASGGTGIREIDAVTARGWMEAGTAVLFDVREPDEHARERIEGATLNPLSRFDAARVSPSPGRSVILHCKSGKRSAEAWRLAASTLPAGAAVYSLKGGIEGWKAAGLPTVVNRRAPALSVMRQVQITIGVGVLAGCALAWFVHPGFIGVPAFFGAGLAFAGATGTCALATLIGKMPWNRAGGGASCSV
jgi:rhodanese-related sulfurtransferase